MSTGPHEGREHVERDHNPTVGCRHERRDFVGDTKRTDGHGRRAGHPNAVDRGQKLGTFGNKMPTPIAGPNARTAETMRGTPGRVAELAVRELAIEVDAGRPVGKFSGAMLEQSKSGDRRVFQCLRDASRIVSEPPTFAFFGRTDNFVLRLERPHPSSPNLGSRNTSRPGAPSGSKQLECLSGANAVFRYGRTVRAEVTRDEVRRRIAWAGPVRSASSINCALTAKPPQFSTYLIYYRARYEDISAESCARCADCLRVARFRRLFRISQTEATRPRAAAGRCLSMWDGRRTQQSRPKGVEGPLDCLSELKAGCGDAFS